MLLEEMDAIAGGYHGDPFRVLGSHEDGAGFVIRALLPQAREAFVVADGVDRPMTVDRGIFALALARRPRAYRLRIKRWTGGEELIDDPYRFPPQLTADELYLFGEGTLYDSWNSFGAHLREVEGVKGTLFAVWAPNALSVTVTGSFNEWDARRHPMRLRDGGVWELFIPGVIAGDCYKYRIKSRYHNYEQLKADPYGFGMEAPPKSASVVCDLSTYEWRDAEWMEARAKSDLLHSPMSVYEVHLESWMHAPHGERLTYRDLAATLVEYVKRLGYTHIELMPIMEHPFSGSWGYQVTGYFAPTARFGPPQEFMYFVDHCHRNGIGVIVDWVPGHFPKDAHGLAYFDGTALYEHADPRKGEHRDWGTLIFNYGRNEVRNFLISNALFWLQQYHIDGLRVDAVASMLYLDYSRGEGEWLPNEYGGRENLDAIRFLRLCNEKVHEVSGAVTIAEESTSFPGVSKPTYLNGLGFTMKWNMGWMHDMLFYFGNNPLYRRFHQNSLTFSFLYAFTENFLLPVSHDEVVHGKGSLIGKMPGDDWQKFANVRAFLAFMYAHPGKKLLFMGSEIGQFEEWNHNASVRWDLLDHESHRRLQIFVAELNRFYTANPALYEVDYSFEGFQWVDFRDADASVICFLRRAKDPSNWLLFCCNFTPVVRHGYRVGVPEAGPLIEVLNSDSSEFGGSNVGNRGWAYVHATPQHGLPFSAELTLPPLAVIAFRPSR